MDLDCNLHQGNIISAEPGPSFQLNSVVMAKAVAYSLCIDLLQKLLVNLTCRKCGVESCLEKKEVKHYINMC